MHFIIEQDLMRIEKLPPGVRVYGVPAARLAEELGKRMMLNSVMVGFFAAVTNVLDPAAVRQALPIRSPRPSVSPTLRPLTKGFEYGKEQLPANVEKAVEEDAIEEIAGLDGS